MPRSTYFSLMSANTDMNDPAAVELSGTAFCAACWEIQVETNSSAVGELCVGNEEMGKPPPDCFSRISYVLLCLLVKYHTPVR
jgi:hypothetical protein